MFGAANSARAFGHAGAHCQVAWADPASGISFAFVKNGLPMDMLADAVDVLPLCDVAAALQLKESPLRTPIAEKLDIEFPIFAFCHCRDVVAAVSRAGGFGVLGALAYTPDELEVELNWIDEHVDGKPYGVDIVMPMKYMGKGGGDEAKFDSLDAMIPQEHREFVEQLLEEHHVPPLPPELDQGTIKAAGLNVDAEAPGQVEVSLAHPGVKMLVNALGPPPPDVVQTSRTTTAYSWERSSVRDSTPNARSRRAST